MSKYNFDELTQNDILTNNYEPVIIKETINKHNDFTNIYHTYNNNERHHYYYYKNKLIYYAIRKNGECRNCFVVMTDEYNNLPKNEKHTDYY